MNRYFDGNLPGDNVPYADFDAPVNSDNPKDSSATAIVASALFELFELTGEPRYLEKAQMYLSSLLLSPSYFNPSATDGWEALLRKSAAAWGEESVGSVTGDYFLLETMASANVALFNDRDKPYQYRGCTGWLRGAWSFVCISACLLGRTGPFLASSGGGML